MNKLIKWLNEHWKEISGIIAAILALLAGVSVLSSCGSLVKATIRTPSDSTQNTISISTNNPVSVTPSTDVTPTITINPK